MTVTTITDPALIARLRLGDVTEFRDPEGRILGSFAAATPDQLRGDDNPPADGVVQSANPPEAKS